MTSSQFTPTKHTGTTGKVWGGVHDVKYFTRQAANNSWWCVQVLYGGRCIAIEKQYCIAMSMVRARAEAMANGRRM